jgi:hypothetical protein
MPKRKKNEGLLSGYRILEPTIRVFIAARFLPTLGLMSSRSRNQGETLPETLVPSTEISLTQRKAFIGGLTIPAKEA